MASCMVGKDLGNLYLTASASAVGLNLVIPVVIRLGGARMEDSRKQKLAIVSMVIRF